MRDRNRTVWEWAEVSFGLCLGVFAFAGVSLFGIELLNWIWGL